MPIKSKALWFVLLAAASASLSPWGCSSDSKRWAAAHFDQGVAHAEKGEWDKAIRHYTKAIELNPGFDVAYYNRGVACGEKGQYEKAIEDYTKAIELDPQDANAYCNRAFAYGGKGQYDKAIADCTEAIELDPQCAMAYRNRGFAYHRTGQYHAAIRDWTKAIELEPENAWFYYLRADAHHMKHEWDAAIGDYSKAIDLDPSCAAAYNNRGWLLATSPLQQFRDGARAKEDATRACELTAWRDIAVMDTLAAACAELADFKAAVRWQAKAVEMAPEAEKPDYQERLRLYQTGKPYRSE
jgi:tetratricopeptide (TPR) repeat protein